MPDPGLDITVAVGPKVAEVFAVGELDLASASQLTASLDRLQTDDLDQIRLDLSGVTFIDSTGLSALLLAADEARHWPGRLEIVPSRSLLRMLELHGVDHRLPLTDPLGGA